MIHGPFGLLFPTYTLVLSFAASLGLIWLYRRAGAHGLNLKTALDLALVVIVGGFLGARLFHVLYEAPDYYWQDLKRIGYFWQGGFVFYGGAITSFIVAVFFLRWRGEPLGAWANAVAPVGALLYAVGRVGCFLNGCCYGDVCTLPWGVEFPHLEGGPRHPTQLYAVAWEFVVLGCLLGLERRGFDPRRTGRLFSLWVLLHAIGRLGMELLRADDRGPQLGGFGISFWLSWVLLGLAVIHLTISTRSEPGGVSQSH